MKIIPMSILVCLFNINSLMAQEISVFPGFVGLKYYINGNRISAKEVGEKMMKVPTANEKWKMARNLNTGAWMALSAQVVTASLAIRNIRLQKDHNAMFYTSLGFGAASIIMSLTSNSARKKAVLMYNKKISSPSNRAHSYNFEAAPSGIGISLKF